MIMKNFTYSNLPISNIRRWTLKKIQSSFLVLLFALISVSGVWGQIFFTSGVTNTSGSGNWTVPCGVTAITVQVWGGGGGGGGAKKTNASGSGGGSGGYSTMTITVTPGTVFACSIGLGGSAGTATGTDGGLGGTSTFSNGGLGINISAAGGTGGGGGNGAINTTIGTGGTATGGTTNTTGASGTAAVAAAGGNGGNAPSGGTGGTGSINVTGQTGNNPGGGGAGGSTNTNNSYSGGAGGTGGIKITWTVALPTVTAAVSSVTVCGGSAITLLGTSTNPSDAGTWSAPSGTFSNATDINGSTWTAPSSAGTVILTLTNIPSSGSGACAVTSTINISVSQGPSLTLTSAVGTNNQTKCISNAITSITYSAGGSALGTTVTWVPAGTPTGLSVTTGATTTISGTPTVAGTYNYTVTTTGGSCGTTTATGTITVNGATTVSTNGGNQTLAACATTTTLTGNTPFVGSGTWTISPPGPSITNPNSPNSGVTGLTPGTTYTFTWTIVNSPCSNSASSMTVLAPIGAGCWVYCTPSGNLSCSANDYISNVTFNTINNSSTCSASGYDDTGISSTVLIGNTYNLTVNNGPGTGSHYVAAYIDWNNNGSLLDAGEFYLLSSALAPSSSTSASIAVPGSAVSGNVKMRIRYTYLTALTASTPCTTAGTYGETEDYILNIQNLTPCSGTPTAGTISISPALGCGSVSITLSATGSSVATGLTFQWEKSSTSDFTSITNVGSVQNTVVTSVTDVPGGTRYYRLKVQCNGGTAYYSNVVMYEAISSSLVYCEPNSTATGYPITNVTFAGIEKDNNITNIDYQDFTCVAGAGSVTPGSSYPISVTFALSGSNANVFGLNVFFDWNADGDFVDAGEEVQCGGYTGFATSGSYNGTINIPANAANAITRMRVMHKYDTYSTPCYNGGNNLNTQDYLLKVGTVAPLPIELMSFQANCEGEKQVDVTWSTASEHNTSHYVVNKSRDGVNWTILNTLAAAGNSTSVIEYALTDTDVASGTTYYRLTQFDIDGVFETFNYVSANCSANETATKLISYPNPSNGSFYVDFYTQDLTGPSSISLIDARGLVIYRQFVVVEKGSNVFHMQDLDAAPGIYYIKVSNGTTTPYIVKHSLR